MTRRRFILTIICCLLAGAMVNVLVAWGLAVAYPASKSSAGDFRCWAAVIDNDEQYMVSACGYEQFGRTMVKVGGGRLPSHSLWSNKPVAQQRRAAISQMPRWSRSALAASDRLDDVYSVTVWGWPFRSLRSTYLCDPDCHLVDAIDISRILPDPPTRSIVPPRSIPMQPTWPGFLANSALYGVVLWGLAFGPFALRRRRRALKGLCPGCGYDLRGVNHAKCPECGLACR